MEYNDLDIDKLPNVRLHNFIFICQKGELEMQSVILAISLRKFLKIPYKLTAVIPGPKEYFGEPDEETIKYLLSLGVEIKTCTNIIAEKNPSEVLIVDKLSNKMFALDNDFEGDRIIFIDSDIIIMDYINEEPSFKFPLAVQTAGAQCELDSGMILKKIFNVCNVTMPSYRTKRWSKCNVYPPILFSDAMYSIENGLHQKFYNEWKDFYLKAIAHQDIHGVYHTGEFVFTVTVHNSQVPYTSFDESWRYGKVLHYFDVPNLLNDTTSKFLITRLAYERPEIIELMNRHDECKQVASFLKGRTYRWCLKKEEEISGN
jgi:hypothetical protein